MREIYQTKYDRGNASRAPITKHFKDDLSGNGGSSLNFKRARQMRPQQKSGSSGGFKLAQPSRIAIMPEVDGNSYEVNDNEKFKTIHYRNEAEGLQTEHNHAKNQDNIIQGGIKLQNISQLALHSSINDEDYEPQINKKRYASNRLSDGFSLNWGKEGDKKGDMMRQNNKKMPPTILRKTHQTNSVA